MLSKTGSEDGELLDLISRCISTNLGFSDSGLTLSKFVLNLYEKATTNNTHQKEERFELFSRQMKANGGESFSDKFLNQVFSIIDEVVVSSSVKKESDEVKIESQVETKAEPIKGLSLPDDPIDTKTLGTATNEHDYSENKRNFGGLMKREHQAWQNSKAITIGSVYKGYVSNITNYGAFIRLNSPSSFNSGLCHVSQMGFDGKTRVPSPSSLLKMNQEVFVKVINIEKVGGPIGLRFSKEKISLSMRGIDQVTGLDKSSELAEIESEGRQSREKQVSNNSRGSKRRLTSPERWEIQQLISSGVIPASDYPELSGDLNPDDELGEKSNESENEDEEVNIELNNDEPAFLKGQKLNSVQLAPVRVVKNPEGSLGRVAMNGSKLVKDMKEERMKEVREQERKARKEHSLSIDVHDPLSQVKSMEEEVASRNESVISEWKKSQMTKNISYGKRTNLSIKEQRQLLPVYSMRSDILKVIRENQFVVVVGETGSGKTTQIVQYLLEEGYNTVGNERKLIGCTQPRRVAAVSVATRVAEEMGCRVGEEVGYTIRFEDETSPKTKIKYMTDGMLQMEALNDTLMGKYSVIMLDEAHERTVATDILFTLLKRAALINPDLKVVVTSATLDSDKFSKFFNSCPIMKIPGRTFPVEILYTKKPELDYLAAALDTVVQIHVSEPMGDILVFLTGQEEIDTSCEVLYERLKVLGDKVPELIILPVYSALPSEIQSKIFEPTPPGSRKVIFATNIAETSITIDGIFYVVDPGFVKINAYDSKLGMDSLVVTPISQAQANQRSGRAGRTGPGKCYRLYTESAFNGEMLPNTVPEIQRQNLTYTILMLKAMGINNLLEFEFMDPPSTDSMLGALQDLYTLGALDDQGYLTPLGRKMADFPMEPALAKALTTSVNFGCSDEIVTIIAMLSVPAVFYRPKDKQKEADQKKYLFHHSHGDHLTLLNVFRSWSVNGYSKQWCKENYIQERSMRRVLDVRKQIVAIMKKYGHPIVSCASELDKVRRTLCAGFFKHSAKRDPQEGYKTLVEKTTVFLHPSSALYGKSSEFVVYHTLLLTTKEYMQCVTVINPNWLVELAPAFFKKSDPSHINQTKRNDKIVPLFDKFTKDKDAWRLSSQPSIKRRALGS